MHSVECADDPLLDTLQTPAGEVAYVDKLQVVGCIAGRQHLAAATDAHRPVGETIGRIVRTHDEARPHHGAATRHRGAYCAFAQGLQWSIATVADDFRGRIVKYRHWRLFSVGLRPAGIDRDAADKQVMPQSWRQQSGRLAYLARHVA